jgi:short subunit dehydrogenase-like uncharacterized protein
MNASAEFDVIVYRATGFTGQLVADYLAARDNNHEQIRWAMAARSLNKLKQVRNAICAHADTSLIVADASDPRSLAAMLRQTRSVISNVGPYQLYGPRERFSPFTRADVALFHERTHPDQRGKV